MSERSCIIVKVRKEDIGKKVEFNEYLLPVALGNWEFKDPISGKIWRNECGKNLCKPVVINEQYIAVYCHWDGRPSGVGAVLKEKFNEYHSSLNLVIGGSVSVLDEKYVRHYANREGETWGYIKPVQGKTQKSVCDIFDWSEYAYLFDEARGGWLYKSVLHLNSDKNGFKPILC